MHCFNCWRFIVGSLSLSNGCNKESIHFVRLPQRFYLKQILTLSFKKRKYQQTPLKSPNEKLNHLNHQNLHEIKSSGNYILVSDFSFGLGKIQLLVINDLPYHAV
jgi:hypothetical protein